MLSKSYRTCFLIWELTFELIMSLKRLSANCEGASLLQTNVCAFHPVGNLLENFNVWSSILTRWTIVQFTLGQQLGLYCLLFSHRIITCISQEKYLAYLSFHSKFLGLQPNTIFIKIGLICYKILKLWDSEWARNQTQLSCIFIYSSFIIAHKWAWWDNK